jgi:hypothetical protein
LYKNILFLLCGYFGTYFLITRTPSINGLSIGEILFIGIEQPELILALSFSFLVGLFGYIQAAVTIFENGYSMIKSIHEFNIEHVLHFIAFLFSFYVLFLDSLDFGDQHQTIIVILIFIFSILLGIRNFYRSKRDKRIQVNM